MKAAIRDRLDTMYSQLVLILEIKKKTIETAKNSGRRRDTDKLCDM